MSEFNSTFANLPHPRALAFLGDAVFELHLRKLAVSKGFSQSKDLHDFTTRRARAGMQVHLLQQLKPFLTEAEQDLVRQGRNVGVSSARRSEQSAHRQATGFEALIGALFLSDRERLDVLMSLAEPALEASEEGLQAVPDAGEETADRAE